MGCKSCTAVFLQNSCSPEPMNMTLFGNRVFAGVAKLGWSHPELRWALIQWLIALKEEDTDIGEECVMWKWRWRLQWCIYKPRNTKDPTPGRLFPQSLGGEHGPAHTLCWTFSLQNCETIIFSCFKSPALWYPVMAALEHGDTIICLFFYLNLVRRFSC